MKIAGSNSIETRFVPPIFQPGGMQVHWWPPTRFQLDGI